MNTNGHINTQSATFVARQDLVLECLGPASVTRITAPFVQGAQKNILIAHTNNDGDYVFKFTPNPNLIKKNLAVSRLFEKYQIPAPKIQMYEHNDTIAEVYSIIPGHTLYEHIGRGVSGMELQYIYTEIISQMDNMSKIDFSGVDFHGFDTPNAVAKENLKYTNNGISALLPPILLKLANNICVSHRGLYHHGITPKNVIVNDQGKITAFIDLDEVSICNVNYAFGVMASKAAQNGLAIADLCSIYNSIHGAHALNERYINFIASLNDIGRRMLWKQSHKDKTK